MRLRAPARLALVGVVWLGAIFASRCSNGPYPPADRGKKIYYSSFSEPPKNLDPAVAYTTTEHVVTGSVYDGLLEYDYLKRPYVLIPGLAATVPVAESLADGRVRYVFELRPDLWFQDDPCFQRFDGAS